ncbi:hypothetical protein [Chryseobacterium kwangjuense]|uniref:P/Homo B domain-containing protein n=1 Tax=Chryseobacterium kwangjuense TaxID=267125 RepID=A0A135WII9_9FLAO|nr:hypothetical protein [Chryseobacterium kwangjuense]KXH84690.1 hypothetical protein AU378_02705 [Chryseobacterium kwangjuense]
MTKIISTVLLLGTMIPAYAQNAGSVGINTSKPEKELTVKGTMKTSGMTLKDPIEKLGADENYSFLIKSPAPQNKITSYNDSFVPTTPAPINMIQFKITCNSDDKDWIDEYDTKINSTKFLVIIASHGFTQPVYTVNSNWITPMPEIYAYSSNGTWKLRADYVGFSTDDALPNGVWTLNLLVFDRTYAKEFNTAQTVNTSGTGAASAPLIQ